ncbi:MAG: alpha/beta fold hydrolase [Oscillospiraceae bacterium]|jgi:dienelactone hydrolase|nr:alpha/beta fold hydrolase [Oscillospiraceae bacterium]
MRKKIYLAFALTAALAVSITGCSGKSDAPEGETEVTTAMNTEAEPTPEGRETPDEIAAALLLALQGGDSDEILAFMDGAMKTAFADTAGELWGQLTSAYGAFSGAGESERADAEGYEIILTEVFFANAALIQRTVIDEDGRVAGLFFSEGTLSGGGGETVTFSADPRYPISGTLTLPDVESGGAGFNNITNTGLRPGVAHSGDVAQPFPAVILIHGSGPSDRDESIGANRVFADISAGLASRGVAVLRYDKRTYTYGAALAEAADPRFTVMDETTDDAEAAIRFLRTDARIDGERIYLLGHSMGGGLLSYIGQNEIVAGYIIMAGTPRRLWELSAEQNLAAAEELEEQSAAAVRELVAAETEKARRLESMTDDESQGETVFGMPAYYLKSFEGIDAPALHLSDKKPVLVLAGGRDRQVLPSDFELWKSSLAGHPAAEFKLYPELNHIFGAYTGENVPMTRLVEGEYGVRTSVPKDVINDVAEFITGR